MEPMVTETAEITFVKRPPVKIELDIDALSWDDVMDFEKLGGGAAGTDTEKLMAIIQKCVPNQDVRKLPATTLKPVMEAVTKALGAITGDEQKN